MQELIRELRGRLRQFLGYDATVSDSPSVVLSLPELTLGSSIDEVGAAMAALTTESEETTFWAAAYGDDWIDRLYDFHPEGSPTLVSVSLAYRRSTGRIFRAAADHHGAFLRGAIGSLELGCTFESAAEILGPPDTSISVAPVKDKHWWTRPEMSHHVSCYSKAYDSIIASHAKGEIDSVSAWLPELAPDGFDDGLADEVAT